ncbi:MAG: Rne/Rng family ribonuclease [Bacillota bacterium]|nr:Rne/Rng family ribonuclease [Bacillota bacterium]
MQKVIVIQESEEDIRVGLLENRRLMEFYLESKAEQPLVGTIFKGRVENVLPGMQAAFVNIGLPKNGFLFVQEAIPQVNNGEAVELPSLPPIEDVVKEGQELLVQIIKEPGGQKGGRISTQITLAGRYVVYMPETNHVGISRRIEQDEERERLKKLAEAMLDPGEGLIVRTVAQGKSYQELGEDLGMLKTKWQAILKKAKQAKAPSVISYELHIGERLVRDFVREDVNEIIVNSRELFEQLKDHIQVAIPDKMSALKLQEGDLFFQYQLYEEIKIALESKVWLKSGGYLVFNQTEALLVVDVNTGKYIGHKSLEDTVFRLNLEAVKEVCRQIRLRNIGGIIVIDFIDMKEEKHRDAILEALTEEVKLDQMRVTVLGLTNLGLIELTRKKMRPSLANLLQVECQSCGGSGLVNRDTLTTD